MIKRVLFILTFFMLTASMFAQWTNVGPWPTDKKGHLHGIAIDPDGKIWVSDYYTNDSLANPGVAGGWQKVRSILVYNPDGTQVSFSPIKMAVGNGISDTLKGATTGMTTDHEGNIIYTHGNPAKLYRFNYKTGAAMAKVDLSLAGKISTGGAAAVDANGNIYVKPVIPGNPVQMYDKDFAYLGNVYDASKGYARTSAVSPDGLTFYDCGYTNNKIYVWHRDDEFTQFAITDSLEGFNTESVCWDPIDAGHLWASAGNTGYDAPGLFGNYQLSSWAWYKIDLANKVLKDSLFWTLSTADNANEKQRGIAISADGKTAYVGCFGASGMPLVQKLTKGGAATVNITFQVNMTIQQQAGNFTPGTDNVRIAGTFTNWGDGALTMTDANSDLIYEVTVPLTPGDALEFKFIKGADGWESISNRTYTVPAAPATFTAFYNDVDKLGAPVTVTFSVNMEYEIASGRFNPATDTVTVRGSFNGWSGTDVLSVSSGDPNYYEFTKQYTVAAAETWNYKYAYIAGSTVVWEGDPNKTYTFTPDNVSSGTAFIERTFNDLTGDNMLNNDVVITFECDMNGAKNAFTGQVFPTVKNVFIAGAVPPLQWPGGGWPNTDQDKVKFLFDDGTNGDAKANDGIWSVNLTFKKYSPLKIQYKYGANWGLPENGGANDNENQVAVDHYLYITPWILTAKVKNAFGQMGDILAYETTDVKQIGENPTTYELAQNYPNPFNPATTITFSIPEAGMVSLKVYDILGKEVANLMNEDKSAGTYTVSFDASNLPTGTYIYKISTGNFTSTRKMLLLK